eukprot:SAG22_NODE_453_length_10316_cov_27.583341_4_plen_147_part_00
MMSTAPMQRMLACTVFAALAPLAHGALTVSNTLGSNMVLQRGRPAPIWGWATPGEAVDVEFLGAHLKATAGHDGLWRTSLPAQPATTKPATIEVKSASGFVTLRNVLFGDVILCSGQVDWAASPGTLPFSLMRSIPPYRDVCVSGT